MLTPIIVGMLFGTRTLAGVLAGALVSGVQMAVSMSNTGGAWDNAKKYIEVRTPGVWVWVGGEGAGWAGRRRRLPAMECARAAWAVGWYLTRVVVW
jgi:hypothetical protein